MALKDLEHKVNLEAEILGIPRRPPQVGPECLKGIEINRFAAELARVSVWVGEIQWMRANGFSAARDPILKPLGTIECRDALLNEDKSETKWPEADVIVGNPPFLGNKRMIDILGEQYVDQLRGAYEHSLGKGVDLVMYWFDKALRQIERGDAVRAGLVGTNSIRGGVNRETLKRIIDHGKIFEAWAAEPWVVEGAAVRVSLVCFGNKKHPVSQLDGKEVIEIFSDLTASVDLSKAARLQTNASVSFQGPVKVGSFDIQGDLARE